MKDKIQEINEEIKKLQEECNNKIEKLSKERDKMIKEQNPPYLNPYFKYKEGDNEYVCKIIDVSYLVTGEINYYTIKILSTKGEPYYHSEFTITPSRLGDDWQFIPKEEFDGLLERGMELIRKDII